MKKNMRKGAAVLEMTLVGIPLVFVMISIFEMSRGMWMYQTAAHAVREGVRFSVVHGINCVTDAKNGVSNNCSKTVAEVAQVIQNAGGGLDAATTTLRFTAPSPGGAVTTCTLASCASDVSIWPPVGSNQVNTVIQIDITTPFRSALAMFWPGAAYVSFAVSNLGATSVDTIQF